MSLPTENSYSDDSRLTKRSHIPLDGDTPPAIPGKPEERKYQAIALIGDNEAGQPSDIASAVFRPAEALDFSAIG